MKNLRCKNIITPYNMWLYVLNTDVLNVFPHVWQMEKMLLVYGDEEINIFPIIKGDW